MSYIFPFVAKKLNAIISKGHYIMSFYKNYLLHWIIGQKASESIPGLRQALYLAGSSLGDCRPLCIPYYFLYLIFPFKRKLGNVPKMTEIFAQEKLKILCFIIYRIYSGQIGWEKFSRERDGKYKARIFNFKLFSGKRSPGNMGEVSS